MAITLQTIESLPLVEEVNENTSLVGWDGEKTVRVASDMVGGSGLPEGGEPHKQLVTDGEGKTVWEDKLAWKDSGEAEFVSNVSVSYRSRSIDLEYSFEEGKRYTVVWDGVSYNCVARNYDGYIMIGNNAIYEYDNGDATDTGEPFVIDNENGTTNGYVTFASGDTKTHTVSIIGVVENIKKIDEKFIPATKPDLVLRLNGGATLPPDYSAITDGSFFVERGRSDDLCKKIADGQDVKAVLLWTTSERPTFNGEVTTMYPATSVLCNESKTVQLVFTLRSDDVVQDDNEYFRIWVQIEGTMITIVGRHL